MKITTQKLILAITYVLLISGSARTENLCCGNCTCGCELIDAVHMSADCSHLGLSTYPRFNDNVIIINLSSNNLTKSPAKGTFSQELVLLDLSYNEISKFEHNSFKQLRNLVSLNLEHNKLELSTVTYYPSLFKHQKKLKILNLKHNVKCQQRNQSYPDETFKDLVSLQTLRIDGLVNNTFGPGFSDLKMLNTLDASGITGCCLMESLKQDTFQNLQNLTKLDVSYCKLKGIEKGAISILSELENLDISYNEELTFSVARNLTTDLTNTSIKVLSLEKIHCTFGLGTEVYKEDVEALRFTNLTELHIGSNKIELLDIGVLQSMPDSLKTVSIGDNKLTFGWYALESNMLKNLEVFNASLQFLSHNPRDIFKLCNDSKHGHRAYLRHNRRETDWEKSTVNLEVSKEVCNGCLRGPEKMAELSEYSQKWKDAKDLSSLLSLPIPLPPNVKTIYFNSSGLRYPIPRIDFQKNKIESIYVQGNVLYEWQGPITSVETIKILDLSNNFCSSVSTYFFDHCTNLRELYVNDNLLGFDLAVDTDGSTFKSLGKLRRFEISSNKIQTLPRLIFSHMVSLEHLDLSENLLRDFKIQCSHMTHLRHLDLSNNQITSLDSTAMDTFDDIGTRLHVNLSGNPLQCTCDTLKFLEWMHDHKEIKFLDFKNYSCSTKDHKTLKFTQLEQEILQLKKDCTSYVGLIAGLSVAIFCCLLAIVAGLVYRYRWKLRYLYYMTKTKYRGYTPVRSSTQSGDQYIFDAFISYADEDRQFGVFDMKKNLEESGNFHLCLHNRDFIPGNEIAENITNAVHFSRKTVCIISENYMKSYWCMFEFNMAQMESIYSRNGENILFLIFYGQIDHSKMPLQLMHLVENQSYIEYPNDPQGNVVFWEKMKETLAM